MPIPLFNDHGWLPDGVHDCTLDEAAARFGVFRGSDRRPLLWARFAEFMREARACRLAEAVLVDGSFVTAKPAPNDIDVVIVLAATHDLSADLPPAQYNLLAQHRVRKRFGLDLIVARGESEGLEQAVAFFQQVRQQPGAKKGLLRIWL
jgi:hypothetical protein